MDKRGGIRDGFYHVAHTPYVPFRSTGPCPGLTLGLLCSSPENWPSTPSHTLLRIILPLIVLGDRQAGLEFLVHIAVINAQARIGNAVSNVKEVRKSTKSGSSGIGGLAGAVLEL
jgi:hypothetical protein